jgi:FKBP-type peptidyl-prolyl cis-trans isomerase 2
LVKVEAGKRVRLKVKLEVVDGEVLEKNIIEYIQGGGAMLAALEKLIGECAVGDSKSGVIPAKEAFGDPDTQTRKAIAKKEFPEGAEFEIGMRFQAKDPASGQDIVLQVDAIEDDAIEVIMCHPLADKDIAYDFEVLAVTDPNPPPLPGALVADAVVEDDDE